LVLEREEAPQETPNDGKHRMEMPLAHLLETQLHLLHLKPRTSALASVL
jgi:hypothetical protein